jgi:hypothetical protein
MDKIFLYDLKKEAIRVYNKHKMTPFSIDRIEQANNWKELMDALLKGTGDDVQHIFDFLYETMDKL